MRAGFCLRRVIRGLSSWMSETWVGILILRSPFSTSGLLFYQLGGVRLLLICVPGVAFGVALCWIFLVRISSSTPLMSVRGMKRFCVVSWLVVSGMAFCLVRFVEGAVPCRFCGGADGGGHLFWRCPYPPLIEIRENPEFHDLMRMDESQ